MLLFYYGGSHHQRVVDPNLEETKLPWWSFQSEWVSKGFSNIKQTVRCIFGDWDWRFTSKHIYHSNQQYVSYNQLHGYLQKHDQGPCRKVMHRVQISRRYPLWPNARVARASYISSLHASIFTHAAMLSNTDRVWEATTLVCVAGSPDTVKSCLPWFCQVLQRESQPAWRPTTPEPDHSTSCIFSVKN